MNTDQPRFADIRPGDVFSLDFCAESVCSCPGFKNCAACGSFRSSRFTVFEKGDFVIGGVVCTGAKIVMHDTGEIRFISWTCLERAKKECTMHSFGDCAVIDM